MMKNVLIAVMCVVLTVSAAFAQETTTYFYPTQENAEFSITLPDVWKTEVDKGTLTAVVEGEIGLVLLPIDAKEVEKMTQEEWNAAVDKPLSEGFTDLEYQGKPTEDKINDIDYWEQDATAKFKSSGKPADLMVMIFFPSDQTTCLLYVFTSSKEAMEKHILEVQNILSSIKRTE